MASQSKQLDPLTCLIKQEVCSSSSNDIETDMEHCELFAYNIEPKLEDSEENSSSKLVAIKEELELGQVKEEEVDESKEPIVLRPFECLLCVKRFTLRSSLRKHLYIHSGVKPFQCDICYRTFNRRSNLTKHTRTHTGEKLYECEVCGRRFSETGTLKRHHSTHHIHHTVALERRSEKPFACDTCGVRFAHDRNRKTHARVHDSVASARYLCAACGRAFSQRAHLQSHVAAVHTGERRHQCAVCGRAFTDAAQLTKHRRTHAEGGGREWRCAQPGCAAAFQQRWALHRHAMVHTGERPYQCALCARRFADSSKLNRHECKVL